MLKIIKHADGSQTTDFHAPGNYKVELWRYTSYEPWNGEITMPWGPLSLRPRLDYRDMIVEATRALHAAMLDREIPPIKSLMDRPRTGRNAQRPTPRR